MSCFRLQLSFTVVKEAILGRLLFVHVYWKYFGDKTVKNLTCHAIFDKVSQNVLSNRVYSINQH